MVEVAWVAEVWQCNADAEAAEESVKEYGRRNKLRLLKKVIAQGREHRVMHALKRRMKKLWQIRHLGR
jgi:predicted GIY-YIG superfamily endonuclease